MKKGEKYIIEIAEVKEHCDDNGKAFPIARIKGFSSLVFDQRGLDKLKKVNDGERCKKPLECRFVCLENVITYKKGNILTQGQTYEVKNGVFKDNFGVKFPSFCTLYTKEELVNYMNNQFNLTPVDIAILKD